MRPSGPKAQGVVTQLRAHNHQMLLVAALSMLVSACDSPEPIGMTEVPGDGRTVALHASAALDFTVEAGPGAVPAFAQRRGKYQVLAVDADKTGTAFAAATMIFGEPSGCFDVRLATLGDGDGRSQYRVVVAGQELAPPFTQPKAIEQLMFRTWEQIRISQTSTIQVLFNGSDSAQNSGGKGPNGFHMAHGRWVSMQFYRLDDGACS